MENKYTNEKWQEMSRQMGDGLDRIVGWGEVSELQRNVAVDIFKTVKVGSMLEIGFNRGASALTWLLNGIDFLYSIDINGSLNSAQYLKDNFNKERERFCFKRVDSSKLKYEDLDRDFDLVFIDGDHSFKGASNDIQKSFLFKPKFLLFDDYFHPGHQADIQAAIKCFDSLEMVKEYRESPGFGLYKVNNV